MGKTHENQVRRFKIIRRDTKYNKYIKWFAETYREDGSIISSYGYRTQREARESVEPKENPFPIGDRLIHLTLLEV